MADTTYNLTYLPVSACIISLETTTGKTHYKIVLEEALTIYISTTSFPIQIFDFHTDSTDFTESASLTPVLADFVECLRPGGTYERQRCMLCKICVICVRQKVDYLIEIDENANGIIMRFPWKQPTKLFTAAQQQGCRCAAVTLPLRSGNLTLAQR